MALCQGPFSAVLSIKVVPYFEVLISKLDELTFLSRDLSSHNAALKNLAQSLRMVVGRPRPAVILLKAWKKCFVVMTSSNSR